MNRREAVEKIVAHMRTMGFDNFSEADMGRGINWASVIEILLALEIIKGPKP